MCYGSTNTSCMSARASKKTDGGPAGCGTMCDNFDCLQTAGIRISTRIRIRAHPHPHPKWSCSESGFDVPARSENVFVLHTHILGHLSHERLRKLGVGCRVWCMLRVVCVVCRVPCVARPLLTHIVCFHDHCMCVYGGHITEMDGIAKVSMRIRDARSRATASTSSTGIVFARYADPTSSTLSHSVHIIFLGHFRVDSTYRVRVAYTAVQPEEGGTVQTVPDPHPPRKLGRLLKEAVAYRCDGRRQWPCDGGGDGERVQSVTSAMGASCRPPHPPQISCGTACRQHACNHTLCAHVRLAPPRHRHSVSFPEKKKRGRQGKCTHRPR